MGPAVLGKRRSRGHLIVPPRLPFLFLLSALGVVSLFLSASVLSAATSRAPIHVSVPTIRGVYYINLEASVERREHFLREYSRNPLPGVEEPVRIAAASVNKTGYGSVGCGRSHILALEAVAVLDERFWYLVCEDDATGNFTTLPSFLKSALGGERRWPWFRPSVNAINLHSPKHPLRSIGLGGGSSFSDKDRGRGAVAEESTLLPGFGTRATAYLVTPAGARWMLRVLRRWNDTVTGRLERYPNATVRDGTWGWLRRGSSIVPWDMVMSWSWEGWVHGVSYRGLGPDSIRPKGTFASTIKVS